MKTFLICLAWLLAVYSISLAQAQPTSSTASAKMTPRKANHSVPKPAADRLRTAQWPRSSASATGGYYYTSQGNYYSPTVSASRSQHASSGSGSVSASGHWFSPTASANSSTASGGNWVYPTNSYYNPVASGGGSDKSPATVYPMNTGDSYTPSATVYPLTTGGSYRPPATVYPTTTGGSHPPSASVYPAPGGSSRTPSATVYTPTTGSSYTPPATVYPIATGGSSAPSATTYVYPPTTGGSYTTPNKVPTPAQGQYIYANGSYSPSANTTVALPQSQNVAPQNGVASKQVSSPSMNTASAADAANSLKSVAQGSSGITLNGGVTTPGGGLTLTYDSSGTKTISTTLGEGALSF